VQELCLHRAPALLDEMVALLISEFQVGPTFNLSSLHTSVWLSLQQSTDGLEALGLGFQQARM
jgi:hypothetical protein